MCPASIKISEIITAAKISATGRNAVNPICHATTAKINPVNNSTDGYRPEIGALQFLHLPSRINQLSIGTLSYGLMGESHLGHAEFGNTIESSFGTRWITTFRKLPTIAPSAKAIAIPTASGNPVNASNEENASIVILKEGISDAKEERRMPKTTYPE